MRKFLSILLIVVGVLVAVYPLLGRVQSWYYQKKLLSDWERLQAVGSTTPSQESIQRFAALEVTFSRDAEELERQLLERSVAEPSNPVEPKTPPAEASQLLGLLKIPKIAVNLPILYGATESNMIKGVGQIEGTSPIGEIGNAALAGHRSQTYGRYLNRLDEIEVGDDILIEASGRKLYYKVYKKHIVEPTDVSVLNRNSRDRVLTIVTCHPIYPATHRLILHAVLIKEE